MNQKGFLLHWFKHPHQYQKGFLLPIYSWVIMTNHVHMIISSRKEELPNIMRDMKSFTSTHIKKAITGNSKESRKQWMLAMMVKAGTKNSNNNEFQLWQQHNHPLILDTNRAIDNTIDYIHNNPVVAGFVENPEDYLYSSARDYAGRKGLIDIEVID
ncbi:MAG: transposase [Bacteroidetes bacterium HGW-Bacteroidetes-21]|nr:MAG: transposase [Bacteroidetes bacterium HGW-Bacteroidetes-21]